uniref:Serpin domain-containing protein n=1 Tax=Heliothis virescens TaxID=7102 RepID=A0A2A4J2N1_HELVI
MRLSIVILALCIAHGAYSQGIFGNLIRAPGQIANGAGNILHGIFGGKSEDPCSKNVIEEYKKSVTTFHNKLYTNIASRSDNHFVFSPYSVWLSLSALAEGSDASVKNQIFSSLNMPQQWCRRKKFYDIALNVEPEGRDVTLKRRRSLILDQDVKVLSSWGRLMRSTGLLSYSYAPIKSNPKETSKKVRNFIGTRSNIVLKGNSVLLDSLDYKGLWTTSFPEAGIRSQPFFNELGQKIGTVQMMHMKKKVRLAHAPFMGAKVLELPVGANGRYTMLIAVGTGNGILKNAIAIFMGSIMEIFSLLQMSLFPLDVAVPMFELSSEYDLRPALEDTGIHQFWRNPEATKFVSDPPATPGGLIQRVSIKIGSEGVEPPPSAGKGLFNGIANLASDTATGVASAVGHEFTADRPFMFALFDTETRTCLYAGAFSRPNAMKRRY